MSNENARHEKHDVRNTHPKKSFDKFIERLDTVNEKEDEFNYR